MYVLGRRRLGCWLVGRTRRMEGLMDEESLTGTGGSQRPDVNSNNNFLRSTNDVRSMYSVRATEYGVLLQKAPARLSGWSSYRIKASKTKSIQLRCAWKSMDSVGLGVPGAGMRQLPIRETNALHSTEQHAGRRAGPAGKMILATIPYHTMVIQRHGARANINVVSLPWLLFQSAAPSGRGDGA